MFNLKFFLVGPIFEGLLESENTNVLQRFQKFWAVIHSMLGMFETEPTLSSIKVSTVALVEIEKIPFSVWIRHHFKIHGTHLDGRQVALTALEALIPYQEVGNGVFELKRESPEVQQFLRMLEDPSSGTDLELEYRALVAKISFLMDSDFEPCSVQHAVGPQVIE